MIKKTIALFVLLATPAFADPASIEHVKVTKNGGNFTFSVTIRHKDTGWDDYVDAWRIKDESGTVLGERSLAHPHVREQPFTRSLSGVAIPAGTTAVWIEARDTVGGWASGDKKVPLR